MLQGKIKAAVRWITERSRSGPLAPTDEISEDGSMKKTVLDVLRSKHPDPHPPHTFSLLAANELPQFENLR